MPQISLPCYLDAFLLSNIKALTKKEKKGLLQFFTILQLLIRQLSYKAVPVLNCKKGIPQNDNLVDFHELPMEHSKDHRILDEEHQTHLLQKILIPPRYPLVSMHANPQWEH